MNKKYLISYEEFSLPKNNQQIKKFYIKIHMATFCYILLNHINMLEYPMYILFLLIKNLEFHLKFFYLNMESLYI